MMELYEAKIASIVVLATGSFIVGLLPAWFSQYGRNRCPLILSLLLCFGGGVLLSTSLVHMLEEIRENLPRYKEYAVLVFLCGFFALYLIDELVHYAMNGSGHEHGHHSERQPLVYERQQAYNPQFFQCEDGGTQATTQLCHIGHDEPCNETSVHGCGLLIALLVHAVLEGLAVGLETSTTQVWLMFGAIASHKLVVGFCLGIELASISSYSFCKHFLSILIFAAGSPIGIGVGMSVMNIPKRIENYLLPILQGLAGGSLFYVSVSEVLPRERAQWHQKRTHRHAGLCQLIAVIIGCVAMTLLTKYMGS